MFIAGVGLRSFLDIPLVWVFGAALACVVAVVIFGFDGLVFFSRHPEFFRNNKSRRKLWLALGAVFLFLGIWRMDASIVKFVGKNDIQYYNGREVFLEGRVADIDKRLDKMKVTLGGLSVRECHFGAKCGDVLEASAPHRVDGKLLVNVLRFDNFQYGDQVSLACRIETPGVFDGFDYGSYLAKSGIYSVCYRPKDYRVMDMDFPKSGAVLTPSEKFGFSEGWRLGKISLMRSILGIRDSVKETFDRYVSYPESSVLSAIVLGLRREIPDGVMEQFRRTGISHIIAISGLHITIITTILWIWLLGAGLPRKWAFWAATLGLVFFLILIGFRASAVRAGIMGWLVIVAKFFGRPRQSINLLLFAAVILLTVNPKLLRLDLGFQLSFLAVFGIMYFEPYVGRLLSSLRVPDLGWTQMKESLTMTLSAQAMVLPWIVFNFNTLSLVSVFANILILPFLSVIMIGGIALGALGFVWDFFAQFAGWVIEWPLAYVIWITDFLSRPDWAAVTVEQAPIWIVASIYGFFGLILWYAGYRKRRNHRDHLFRKKRDIEREELEVSEISF